MELPPLVDHRIRERKERDAIVNAIRKQQGLPVDEVQQPETTTELKQP